MDGIFLHGGFNTQNRERGVLTMEAIAKETKIRKGTCKHIESELFAYHDTLKEIERLRDDFIEGTSVPDEAGGRSNLPGDPTGRKVTTMLMNRRLQRLSEIANAIEEVYMRLPGEKKQLMNMVYWTKPRILTWEGIGKELHVSSRQAMRWRDEVIWAIAELIGWR